MNLLQDKIVPLARIVRTHGFPKLGVCTFKADLFSTGGQIFKGRSEIYISKKPAALESDLSNIEWEKVTLSEPLSPHGGGFGHAKGLLIKLKRGENELKNHCVGLPRSALPLLNKAFYIADLLGKKIANEKSEFCGVIVGFEDNGNSNVEAVNLKVRTEKGFEFSFPSTWILADELKNALSDASKIICVEGVSEWMIDPKTSNDEGQEGE